MTFIDVICFDEHAVNLATDSQEFSAGILQKTKVI